MNIAVTVFAKTPGLKTIRNRLSRSTSKDFAAEFYQMSLNATRDLVLEMTKSNSDIDFIWAVEEKEGLKDAYWADNKVIYQGDGGLGDRIDRLYKKLLDDYDAVFIMMPNTAQISPEVLEFDILNFLTSDYDFMLGKMDNGDFYFFGGSKEVPLRSWINVPYYCSITFSELDKSLAEHGKVLHMSESFGILERGDLEKLKDIDQDGLLDSQEQLLDLALTTEFKERFAGAGVFNGFSPKGLQ